MPDKYMRDNDSIENTLRQTHETVGRLRTLLDDLAHQINDLESEIKQPREKGPQP
ncbi:MULTISPECIES: hypothetical protein [Nocardia]|uniref:hypothetical protein n=2 Tax=Nocardiaceae TaxID=85025 RepID=UPI0012FB9BA9|nr:MULTISPECIES: hypothetical protein [Nocardia]